MAKYYKVVDLSTGRADRYQIQLPGGEVARGLLATEINTVVAGVIPASSSAAGIVELATDAETLTGALTTHAVTPANLASYMVARTNAQPGILESSQIAVVGGGGQLSWSAITPTFAANVGRDASFIKMGTWATPISITQTSDHWVAIQVNLKKKGDIAFDTAAARFRVDTDGAQPTSAVGCLQLRQNLAHNLASSAILNASVNVSAAVAVQTGSLLGGYFSIEGSGAITKAGSNDCTPLVAVNNNTGGGIDNVIVAMQNGTGTTVTEIVKIVCTHGTASNGLHIYNTATDGTMTTAIKIFGALTNVFDFTGASGAVLEDSQAFPDKAGSIKILTPSGAVAYINYYDGTAG